MARIRTIKPEAFISESLARVGIAAERTFFGLLTQADDHGRFRDQAAVIAGALWSLRPEHGPLEVEDDLNQLDTAGLICRYEGDDGKRYLHIVTFSKHQKVNRPSGSRNPACPRHEGGRVPEASLPTQGVLHEGAAQAHAPFTEPSATWREHTLSHVYPGQEGFSDPSGSMPGGVQDPAVSPHGPDLGPRIVDLGSTPLGGASASTPDTVSPSELVAEYVAACTNRPPADVLGRLGKTVGKLLAEGIGSDHIRTGLTRLRERALHPSVLPSLVNEAMNPPRAAALGRGHRPYANPVNPEAAYGGAL
ncbi:hypothetical protein [Streptomyces sp. NBC_01244]|uniref:hypothetical protein n=1 Tax=Streptomyces sp. NBC_01244 TaxID=2903797 RepID=UPI002E0F75D0|nr:hypothetical protein OG247_23965 [Streptomyces sp. NBC_01244]